MDENSTVEITKAALKSESFDYVGAVKSIAQRNAEADRSGGMLMWDASLVFGGAKRLGLIGKGEGSLWSTQSDYATAAGYSGSGMGTLLPRLSKSQDLGVRRDSRVWTFLTKHGQSGRVGAVVKSAETGKDLIVGLNPLMAEVAETGKVAPKAGETRGAGKAASEKDGEPIPAVTPAIPADVAHALHALRVPVHGFTAEQWTETREFFLAFVADEDRRRETIAKAADRKASRQQKVAETDAA